MGLSDGLVVGDGGVVGEDSGAILLEFHSLCLAHGINFNTLVIFVIAR